MKTTKIYTALALISVISWNCASHNEVDDASLKSSVNSNAVTLTAAVNAITTSVGYQVLSVQNTTSATGPSLVSAADGIAIDTTTIKYSLADVAGIWDYKAALNNKRPVPVNSFFQNSGTSNDLILRMPEAKVKHPAALFIYRPSDTTLVNNYIIDVSKYDRVYKQFRPQRWYWTYDMASNISVSGVSAGDLSIQSSNQSATGYHFKSGFAFADGYVANTSYSSGDTVISLYNISKNNTTLYQEKFTSVKTGSTAAFREREYSLTIGNVEIVRKPGPNSLDSAKVYLAGVLQTKAKVEIIDTTTPATVADSTETTVCNHKRVIQITFDDGTVTTISQLLTDNTLQNIRNLFATIRQAYFATDIVDNVANYIYRSKQ